MSFSSLPPKTPEQTTSGAQSAAPRAVSDSASSTAAQPQFDRITMTYTLNIVEKPCWRDQPVWRLRALFWKWR